MKRLFAALLALLALACVQVAGPAQAQQVCQPREQIVARLQEHFGERSLGGGLANNGRAAVEILTTDTGSTWTIIVFTPNGPACVVAAGTNWRWRGPEARKDPKA